MKRLLATINSALGEGALPDSHLDDAFEVWWPKLAEKIDKLPPDEGGTRPQRSERDILEEILALVRTTARVIPSEESGRRVGVPSRQMEFLGYIVADLTSELGIDPSTVRVHNNDDGGLRLVIQRDSSPVTLDLEDLANTSVSTLRKVLRKYLIGLPKRSQ